MSTNVIEINPHKVVKFRQMHSKDLINAQDQLEDQSEALNARSSSVRRGKRRGGATRIRRHTKPTTLLYIISVYCYYLIQTSHFESASSSASSSAAAALTPTVGQFNAQQATGASFPGVSRDLASFCSARPSLSIDLASMIVHVKKSTSFNYKLYLFSSDNYVFQTGQIVPRDDFRIHSFPVKLKHFSDFLPANVASTYQQHKQSASAAATTVSTATTSLDQVPSAVFNVKHFFSQVPIDPSPIDSAKIRNSRAPSEQQQANKTFASTGSSSSSSSGGSKTVANLRLPFDVHGDALPGDETFAHHDVALVPDLPKSDDTGQLATQSRPSGFDRANSTIVADNVNRHIQFDRDDQVAILDQASKLRELTRRESLATASVDLKLKQMLQSKSTQNRDENVDLNANEFSSSQQQMIMPVGAFSSFHVNLTYLVRKDFGQREPELIRLQIDPVKFQVTQLDIMLTGTAKQQVDKLEEAAAAAAEHRNSSTNRTTNLPIYLHQNDDFAFLSHKLLRDANTRITSINQIYEDWITRNFYTIVYIQRKLDTSSGSDQLKQHKRHKSSSRHDHDHERTTASAREEAEEDFEHPQPRPTTTTATTTSIVTDRLVFRGSSAVLLGADQLEYQVKASAFITEKNGLHYYLEFLTGGKFYLGAIDWTKRPFIILDSQRFPTSLTKTLFDNEELLLCPPSVCYSARPIDEVVSYGRIALSEQFQREALILTKALSEHQQHQQQPSSTASLSGAQMLLTQADKSETLNKILNSGGGGGRGQATLNASVDEHVEELTSAIRVHQGDSQLAGRNLHLRDVESATPVAANSTQPEVVDEGAEHKADNLINLDALIEAIRRGSGQLEVRLHLRDWTWKLPRHVVMRSRSLVAQRVANKSGVSVAFGDGEETSGQVAGGGVGPLLGSKFGWHFEWARRNDIKVNPDTYGFVLTGQAIDASYRVYNELYLISANHLITINYTNSSETVTSVRPIGDEFAGLSSSLLDPITGAYYDRYANQIYFFKGDRYVGYDYATKQPLEDFLLPPAIELLTGTGASPSLMLQIAANSDRQFATPLLLGKTNQQPQQQQQQPPQQKLLVSSLPVVSILGRQHYVDAIYHDLHDDHVYIFAGMKFYTFQASDFKDGAFKSARQPALHCINEHFLDGCRFDEAYSNPCISESDQGDAEDDDDDDDHDNINHNHESDSLSVNRAPSSGDKFSKLVIVQNGGGGGGGTAAANSSLDLARDRQKMSELAMDLQKELNFSDEQQLKLRSIAARGGGRLDYLLESTLMGHGAAARAAVKPFVVGHEDNSAVGSAAAQPTQLSDVHERIVIYLLVAMVLITILVTVAMIFVIVNWTAATRTQQREAALSEQGDELKSANPDQINNSSQAAQAAAVAATAYQPAAISQYLSNQYYYRQHQPTIGSHYHHQARHHHQAGGYLGGGGGGSSSGGGGVPHYHQPRSDFARRSSQPPLPPPPPPQSQLFDALAHQASQMSKSTNGGRSTSSRFDDNMLDSSAL